MKKYLLVLLGLSFLLSEILFNLNTVLGFISYTLLISGCLIALSRKENLDDSDKLIVIFMILPIIRIAELFITFSYIWRSALVYSILCFLVLFYSIKFKINPGYTKKWLSLLPLIIVLGIILGVMGNQLLNFNQNALFLFLLPLIAFSEELLFRGLIQNLVGKNVGFFSSIFFTSLLYFIFSLSLGFPIALFFFAVSLVICLVYHSTKNIYLAMALNLIVQLFILVMPKIYV
jgi:membrane protease YdiL (CAAX protease family)